MVNSRLAASVQTSSEAAQSDAVGAKSGLGPGFTSMASSKQNKKCSSEMPGHFAKAGENFRDLKSQTRGELIVAFA